MSHPPTWDRHVVARLWNAVTAPVSRHIPCARAHVERFIRHPTTLPKVAAGLEKDMEREQSRELLADLVISL